MSPPSTQAEEIARASKSNLALAFFTLPRDRRRDISVFYAFCRLVDDAADDPGASRTERQASLDLWKRSLVAPVAGESGIAAAVRELIGKYRLPIEHFLAIIAGCEMDLADPVFHTWEELRGYCHRVASVVGLVSIEIFGYRDPGCRQYALDLGLALQLTNILRDVGEDYVSNGRIYLPREEMHRFGYHEADLAAGIRNNAFLALMQFQANRADGLYQEARQALPAVDRRSMLPAEIMRTIYQTLLARMARDQFQIFKKRYRLGRLSKALCIARVILSRG